MFKLSRLKPFITAVVFAVAFSAARIHAQNLTLEGQTGGFITPTAYVVLSEKGHVWSHPAVGYHFVNASKVIGYVHTFSIEEGIANRFEFGYTRSVHTKGNDPSFSRLWDYSGMNVFNGKVVGIRDGQFGPWTPGIGAGFVVRTNDKFVSGALNELETGKLKSYTNGDVYVSIIPFNHDVNVGSSNYAATWLNWSDWDSDNQTCTGRSGNCLATATTMRTSSQNTRRPKLPPT